MKDSIRPFHALILFAILPLALRLGVQLPLALATSDFMSADPQGRRDIGAKSQRVRGDAARWAERAVNTAALMRSLYDDEKITP